MKYNKSNLLYFFLILTLSSTICSCNSNSVDVNEIVPYRNIDTHFDLTYYTQLSNNTALYFDYNDGKTLGYRGHGIIIFRSNDQYYAYDATCTYDVDSDEHVEMNDPNDSDAWEGVAVCPVCKSQFLIQNGAFPLGESVAKYPLKAYKTNKSGNILHIYN